ncbi:MAG: A24 family peptidase [Bdellovibrionales bacterium]
MYAVAYFYFALRNQEGMGGGDIKLLGWLGAVLSWTSVPFIILTSSLMGSLAGAIMALLKNSKMGTTTIPFGPYLALGAFLYIFAGEELTNWYLDLFIPNR